jgi:hypothetical protein
MKTIELLSAIGDIGLKVLACLAVIEILNLLREHFADLKRGSEGEK